MITIALTIAALLAAGPLPTQEGGIIRQQLAEADKLVVGRAANTGIEGFGDLNDGDEANVTLTLRPGGQYFIVGVCDSDCSDLDMTALNAAGDGLDMDVETDDVPLLDFTADSGGRVTLNITMADCGAEPCGYGYRVYLAN